MERPRSFRFVCEPDSLEGAEDLLRSEGYAWEDEPFSPWCKRLVAEPRPLGSSLAAFFGFVYIQDRSSMLPPLALAPEPGAAVLDMCASPGGKAGFLAQLTGAGGFVLANEPSKARLATLKANLAMGNLLWAGVCSAPGQELPLVPGSWQRILLDPPCSGWGTEEKHPRVREIWRGEKIGRLVALQRELLRKAAGLLAPGGRLLYSTCTVNPRENEGQTLFATRELGLAPEPLAPFPGFVFDRAEGGGLLVNGEESGAQGFYLSLFRKPPDSAGAPPKGPRFEARGIPRESLASPVIDASRLPPGQVSEFNGKIRFLPEGAFELLPANFPWRGFFLGKTRPGGSGPRFTPWPRLRALANRDGPKIAVDDPARLRDLLAGGAARSPLSGEAILCWKDLPLGFASVKNGRIIASFR